MRAVVIRSLVVIGVGALVLAGVLYVASTVDTRPPEVLGVQLTQPLPDDPDRALITTSIEIAFSEPIEADGAADAVLLDPPVPGSVSWSGSTLIFTPLEPLDLDTEYTVTIGPGIRDPAGNEMTELPAPYTFATIGRPVITATEPAAGTDDVPVDAIIALDFSTLMDTASVEAVLQVSPPIPHDLRWSGQRLEIVPRRPLDPARDYTVQLGAAATDVAGVALGEPVTIGFRTVAPGLAVEVVVPADRTDGIAPRTPIAVVFDRAIDPDSVDSDLLLITPSVAGTLEVAGRADDPGDDRVLRFVPSAPLPANTTFEIELRPGMRGEAGGDLAEPVQWSFTTGAPQPALSNQVLFLSERSGVTNVWAMNPDGTGQRQVSAELEPILDYAVAPNGSSLVVGDGRRLVYLAADGSGRRVLTETGLLEFDPAYAPDGTRIAFARADASSGTGSSLWTWEIGAGAATELELPPDIRPGVTPPESGADDVTTWLRAPRFAPDGQALAYVDMAGYVGIVELPAERHTRVEARAASAPAWRSNSGAILVTLVADGGSTDRIPLDAPVAPLRTDEPAGVGLVQRSGTRLEETGFGNAARLGGVAAGRVAYMDARGVVRISEALGQPGRVPDGLDGTRIAEVGFGPGEAAVVIVTATSGGTGISVIERVDLESGERTRLVRGGWHVRWLP